MPIGERSVIAKKGQSAERLGMPERGALMEKRPERGALRQKRPGARSADDPWTGPKPDYSSSACVRHSKIGFIC